MGPQSLISSSIAEIKRAIDWMKWMRLNGWAAEREINWVVLFASFWVGYGRWHRQWLRPKERTRREEQLNSFASLKKKWKWNESIKSTWAAVHSMNGWSGLVWIDEWSPHQAPNARGKSLFHSNQLLRCWAGQLVEWKESGWVCLLFLCGLMGLAQPNAPQRKETSETKLTFFFKFIQSNTIHLNWIGVGYRLNASSSCVWLIVLCCLK